MTEQSRVPSIDETPDLSLGGEAHVAAYLATNGETGYIWNGVPILLLTTRGRKSGEPRTIPIIFSRDGDNFVILGSVGGAPTHAQWYRNLLADPYGQVQVKAEKYEIKARVAEGAERSKLWAQAASEWPRYDLYQTRTDRIIPVVVLERVGKLNGS